MVSAIISFVAAFVGVYGAVHTANRDHTAEWDATSKQLTDIIVAQRVQGEQLTGIGKDISDMRGEVKAHGTAIQGIQSEVREVRRIAEHADKAADKAHARLDKMGAPSGYRMEENDE